MLNVMIVDDSRIVRKTLKNKIEELGHTIQYEAEDGRQAVTHYRRNQDKIDLITMDISMPVLNGILALREIISMDPDAKIVMITSHGEEELVMEAVMHGAVGYILKPITAEKLKQQLDKWHK